MIRASSAASATTAAFTRARASRPRSHPPGGVSPLDSAGRAARAPWMSTLRRCTSPRLPIPRSLGLPPVVICLGTSPSQAARSRPRPKVSALPIAAASAVAFSGPMPGIVANSRAASSVRAWSANSSSKPWMRRSSPRHSSRMSSIGSRLRGLKPAPRAERHLGGGQKGLEMRLQLAPPLGHDDAALQQEGTRPRNVEGVGEPRAFLDGQGQWWSLAHHHRGAPPPPPPRGLAEARAGAGRDGRRCWLLRGFPARGGARGPVRARTWVCRARSRRGPRRPVRRAAGAAQAGLDRVPRAG